MDNIQPTAEYGTEKTWWSRNWKWVVPVGCGVPVLILLVCGGLLFGIFYWVMGLIKGSDAYTDSLQMVQQNALVQAELGTPIEPGYWVMGEINLTNNSGDADISYSVSGPQGEGTVYVVAEKAAGQWDFKLIRFVHMGNEIILVDNP